jgi:spore germination protein KA
MNNAANKSGISSSTQYEELKSQGLTNLIESNINLFKKIFNNDDTLKTRYFTNQMDISIKCCIIFINGMVDVELINKNITQPIMQNSMLVKDGSILTKLQEHVIVSNKIEMTADIDKLVNFIVSGSTVLFLDGSYEALVVDTEGWQSRAIEEPESEKVL